MTVLSVVKDVAARTLTITSHFDAPIERVWRIWSEPRLLERWWGPPAFPATVTEHDLTPGGTVACADDEAMAWLVASGTDAGMTAAVGQIDELLGLTTPSS